MGEPWNVSNLPTSCPSFWKYLTQRSRLPHPSLAPNNEYQSRDILTAYKEGPLWVYIENPSLEARNGGTATKARTPGRKKEDRM